MSAISISLNCPWSVSPHWGGTFHFPRLLKIVPAMTVGGKHKLWGILIANSRHFDRDCRILTPRSSWTCDSTCHCLCQCLTRPFTPSNSQSNRTGRNQWPKSKCTDSAVSTSQCPTVHLSLIQWELMQGIKKEGEWWHCMYAQLNQHVVDLRCVQTGCDHIATTPLPLPTQYYSIVRYFLSHFTV